jgi:hypothetical protein
LRKVYIDRPPDVLGMGDAARNGDLLQRFDLAFF